MHRCGAETKLKGKCRNIVKQGSKCWLHTGANKTTESDERTFARDSRLKVIKNWPKEPKFWKSYKLVGKPLGKGAYAIVFKVKDEKKVYALKALIYRKSRNTKDDSTVLSKVDHPNIVKFYRKMIIPLGPLDIRALDDQVPVILTEFVSGKTLKSFKGDGTEILKGILKALEYLHSQKIVHRDIKPDNIIVSKKEGILIDFGLAYKFSNNKETDGDILGTTDYMAPEFDSEYDRNFSFYEKADIFGLGASFYRVIEEKPNWNKRRPFSADLKRIKAARKKLNKTQFAKVISKMLNPSPSQRPTASEVLKMLR
jgi:serine/threonine protein kinase